jgi:myo-inositol-1-phosphate synthase
MKIKKLNLQKNVNVSSNLKTLNDIFLKCYEEHFLRIEMIDANEHEVRTKQTIIVVNMTKIDMILSLSWFVTVSCQSLSQMIDTKRINKRE